MNTPTIHISDYHAVPTYGKIGITHVISIGSDDVPIPDISSFKGDFNLYRFDFDDVASTIHPNTKPPSEPIIRRMIEVFNNIKSQESSVLFHCTAGRSRSPAAAFIYLVQSGLSYQEAYKKISDVRGFVQPNPLMIKLADKILGHHGKMLYFVCHASGHPDYLNQ